MKPIAANLGVLQESLDRLRERAKNRPDPMFRCHVCRDNGMVELVDGRWDAGWETRTVKMEASLDHPVFSRCEGPKGMGCPHVAFVREKARERAGRKSREEI